MGWHAHHPVVGAAQRLASPQAYMALGAGGCRPLALLGWKWEGHDGRPLSTLRASHPPKKLPPLPRAHTHTHTHMCLGDCQNELAHGGALVCRLGGSVCQSQADRVLCCGVWGGERIPV